MHSARPEAEAGDAEPLHKAVLLVVPNHPGQQPIECHRDHRVSRRKAVTRLGDEAESLGAGALHYLLEEGVEADRTEEVHRGAQPGAPPRGKRLDYQEHHEQDDGEGQLADRLHDGGEPRLPHLDHKQLVRGQVEPHDVTLVDVLEEGDEHDDGDSQHDEPQVLSDETREP